MSRAASLVREARRAAGLTQAELAARLGLSQSAIAKLERADSNPTVETLDRTLRATGHRLQLIAPAWTSGPGEPGPSIDESLVRQDLERTPAERIKHFERNHAELRRLQTAMLRSRERVG